MIRVLAHPGAARAISRRSFLAGATVTVVGGASALGGCRTEGEQSPAPSAGLTGPLEDRLNIYTWAQYDAPNVLMGFTETFGPEIEITPFGSTVDMIAKLVATKGTSGFDVVVPTGVYIPQMVANGLLETLDLARIPNFENIGAEYRGQPWDPGNTYSVPKAWGTTGFVYDKSKISRPMATWQDFIDAAQNEASGQTSILDSPRTATGLYFWSRDEDWNTDDPELLDACEDFLVGEVAPHVKAFESSPGSNGIPQGTFALSQIWNGDARLALLNLADDALEWVLPGPRTELWMDTWAIPADARNVDAAYAWINYNLDLEVSLETVSWIGYHTGVEGIERAAREAGVELLDLIFFTPEQLATMEAGEESDAEQRRAEIFTAMKAAVVD